MLVFLQKTDVMIGPEQISGQLNMIPSTSLATPQKAKATRVQKEKVLLVAAPCQANKAKAEVKARAILRAIPKGKIMEQRRIRLTFPASQAMLVWVVVSLTLRNASTI